MNIIVKDRYVAAVELDAAIAKMINLVVLTPMNYSRTTGRPRSPKCE
jgi:hypothetical protein